MRRFDAVIFDLDGVICHTDEYHYFAWKSIADSIGVKFDRNINNLLRGVSRMASLDIILAGSNDHFTQQQKEALAEKKNELYKQSLCRMSPADLSAEVKLTLDSLRKKKYLLAIGSSSKNASYILQRIGLGDFF